MNITLVVMLAFLVAMFWLGWRAMNRQEEMPVEDEPEVPPEPVYSPGYRWAGAGVGALIGIAVFLLTLVGFELAGHPVNPQYAGPLYGSIAGVMFAGHRRPAMFLEPVKRALARFR